MSRPKPVKTKRVKTSQGGIAIDTNPDALRKAFYDNIRDKGTPIFDDIEDRQLTLFPAPNYGDILDGLMKSLMAGAGYPPMPSFTVTLPIESIPDISIGYAIASPAKPKP